MAERVEITRLGASGDGIAETADGTVFVAGALPGETATIEIDGERGRLVAIERAAPDRAEPFCPHFGRCGGCAAQHMAPLLYAAWKAGKLDTTLRRAGLTTPPGPMIDAHGAGRRRVVFHGRTREGRMEVGFMAARSHDLVPIARCPVAARGLDGAAAAATALAALVAHCRKPIDLAVTATPQGLDVDLRGTGPLDETMRQRLIAGAGELDLARLALHGEVLIERRRPRLPMGPGLVTPPPGAFLQATREGEEALGALVVEACGGARRVLDLFAGCGPFSLRLAQRAEVHAVETDRHALAALDRALRDAAGLRRVTTERRDLFRRPLLSTELSAYGAVVLDPPRAGAEAQARQIAAAPPETVVMVSCDPTTFARDVAILEAGGLVTDTIRPVDQFKWSAHLEVVGVLRHRPAARRRR